VQSDLDLDEVRSVDEPTKPPVEKATDNPSQT
jgi:hypothetical protein